MDEPVNNILKTSLESIKDMIDTSGIIGKPIGEIEDALVIPVSKVKLSFASGGVEMFKDRINNPYGGGMGGSVSITPQGFLVIKGNNISLLHLESKTHIYEELISKGENIINNLTKGNKAN